MIKNVLILAYDFYPYHSIAAQRPYSWLKYFPDNNIQVRVVTRHWDRPIHDANDCFLPSISQKTEQHTMFPNAQVISVPYVPNLRDRLLIKYGKNKKVIFRKMLSYLQSIGKFYFPIMDETNRIYQAAAASLQHEKADLIIASGEPFILFKHAHKLSLKFSIPWVADYRDCWTNNYALQLQNPLEKIKYFLLRNIEKNMIRTAAYLTTPSPSYQKKLKEIHPEKKIEVIYNGFDIVHEQALNQVAIEDQHFEIAYAGIFYAHQKLELFLAGFKNWIAQHPNRKVKIIFYGLEFYSEMVSRLKNYDATLNQYIQITPRFAYNDVLLKLKKAHVMLLLSSEGADWLNAKIFDYLALKKPVLLVENDKGILEKILTETNTGYPAKTIEDVVQHLELLYQKFYVEKNKIEPNPAYINYSRKHQAFLFSELIKENF